MHDLGSGSPSGWGAGGPVIVAVCGKGGAGKTSISAAIVKELLRDPAHRVLAIDADPAVGLASALGVEVTRTVDDIRSDVIRQLESGTRTDRREILAHLDYQVFEAVRERGNLAFLAIGRPEKQGCYCNVNDFLRDIIGTLVGNFDAVVIDGEAGIEQVNRRVLERVTHLVQVSDGSARGITVAQAILKVAQAAVAYERTGLILNRIRGEAEARTLAVPDELNYLGWVPEDDAVRRSGMQGTSLLDLPPGPFLEAVRACLARVGIPAAWIRLATTRAPGAHRDAPP